MAVMPQTLFRTLLAAAACLLAAACASQVDTFTGMPSGTKDAVEVTEIIVETWRDETGVGPDPDPVLEQSVSAALTRALRGGSGRKVEIAVFLTDFEHVEPGEKWILGGYRGLTAEVQIRDAGGGKVIGHYRIIEDLAKPSFVWPALELDESSDVEIAGNLASSVRRLLYY